jgi:hypothetical protein
MDGGIEGLKRFPDPASGVGEGSPAGEDDAGRGVAGGKRRPLSAFEGVIDGAIKLRGTATFLAPDHALRHAFGPTLSGKRLKRVLKLSHQTLDPFFERRDGDLLSCYGHQLISVIAMVPAVPPCSTAYFCPGVTVM